MVSRVHHRPQRAGAALRDAAINAHFARLIQRTSPKSWAEAAGEVNVCAAFLENFSGDNVRFLARGFSAPGNHAAWDRAARALSEWQRLGTMSARDEFASLMCDAYGVPVGAAREQLLEWWRAAVSDARAGDVAASVREPGRDRVH